MIGSDDVLACFIAGNAFTWDDWFRLETKDDSLQPTIDMLLNVSIFLWYGAICPWHKFVANNVIPIYRLIPLGILVLLLRRLPMVLLYHKFKLVKQIEDIRHASFVGFFGPMGVSAIFYLYITKEFLLTVTPTEGFMATIPSQERPDAQHLSECIEVVVWFLVVCSIVVHGLSIPLGKLGLYIPRTLSTAISSEGNEGRHGLRGDPGSSEQSTIRVDRENLGTEGILRREFQRRRPTTSELGVLESRSSFWPISFVRLGWRKMQRDRSTHSAGHATSSGFNKERSAKDHRGTELISNPFDARKIGHAIGDDSAKLQTYAPAHIDSHPSNEPRSASTRPQENDQRFTTSRPSVNVDMSRQRFNRSILFADERRRDSQNDLEMGRTTASSASAQHEGFDPADEILQYKEAKPGGA